MLELCTKTFCPLISPKAIKFFLTESTIKYLGSSKIQQQIFKISKSFWFKMTPDKVQFKTNVLLINKFPRQSVKRGENFNRNPFYMMAFSKTFSSRVKISKISLTTLSFLNSLKNWFSVDSSFKSLCNDIKAYSLNNFTKYFIFHY